MGLKVLGIIFAVLLALYACLSLASFIYKVIQHRKQRAVMLQSDGVAEESISVEPDEEQEINQNKEVCE